LDIDKVLVEIRNAEGHILMGCSSKANSINGCKIF